MRVSSLTLGTSKTMKWSVVASSRTISNYEGYLINTMAGAYTITLPANPGIGWVLAISDGAGNAATHNITISRNGEKIDGSATNKVISTNNASLTLIYSGTSSGWKTSSTVQGGGSGSYEYDNICISCGNTSAGTVKTTEVYDFSSWSTGYDAPSAVYGQMSGTRGHYVIGVGGYNGSVKNYCFEHDGSTWYTRSASITSYRGRGRTLDGLFYTIAGLDSSNRLQSVNRYDGYAWLARTDLPTPAREGVALFTLSDHIHCCFGYSGSGLTDHDVYDPSNNTWSSSTSETTPDRWYASGGEIDGVGYIGYGANSGGKLVDCDSFDGSNWKAQGDGPSPGRYLQSVSTVRGRVVFLGGRDSSNNKRADVDTYDGIAWSNLSDLSVVREEAMAGNL